MREAELKARAMRKAFLPTRLLGEPAWDILIELFVQDHRMKPVSIARACAVSGVPYGTALRWLALLEQESVIKGGPAIDDSSEPCVELTEVGLKAVSACVRCRAAMPL